MNKKEFYRTYLTFRALSEIEMEMAMAALQGEAAEEAEADQVSFSKFWNNFKITGISIYYLSKFKNKPKSKNKKWWIWLSLLWRRATMLMDNLKKMENFQTCQTCYLSSTFLTFGDLWMTSRPSFLESLLYKPQFDVYFGYFRDCTVLVKFDPWYTGQPEMRGQIKFLSTDSDFLAPIYLHNLWTIRLQSLPGSVLS